MVQSFLLLRGSQETSQKVPPYLPGGGGWLIRCWHYIYIYTVYIYIQYIYSILYIVYYIYIALNQWVVSSPESQVISRTPASHSSFLRWFSEVVLVLNFGLSIILTTLIGQRHGDAHFPYLTIFFDEKWWTCPWNFESWKISKHFLVDKANNEGFHKESKRGVWKKDGK